MHGYLLHLFLQVHRPESTQTKGEREDGYIHRNWGVVSSDTC